MGMVGFWIAAAVMVGVALMMLIAPLVRRRRVTAPARTAYDVAVFKDQLREVDKDLERGLLDDTQATAARTEIKRRLLQVAGEDTQEVAHKPGGAVTSNLLMVVVLALLVPAGALGLYRTVGTPGAADLPLAGRTDPAMKAAKEKAEVNRLLNQLEQRMEEMPDDVRGWRLLAQTYQSRQRFADAAQAASRVVTLTDRAPEALSAYGEALTMANKFTITPIAYAVFSEAYRKDPTESRAAYYIGLYEAQNENFAKARDVWTALAKRSDPDAPWMGLLSEQLSRMAEKMGIAPSPQVAAPSAPGPSAADVKASQSMSGQDRDAMIRSMVQRLADKLKADPNDREGWLRLSRAYDVLGEAKKAIEARAKADALEK